MKKKWVWFVVIAVVVSVGIGLLNARRRSKEMKLVDVVEGPIVEAIYAIGKVEAVRRFQVKAGVPSGIARLPIREGLVVKAGDMLVGFVEGSSIRAPFAGMVTRVNYKVGESVFAGNVIAEMIDPSEYELRVVLDQRAALRVKNGQTAKLSFDGLRTQEFQAKVRAVYSSEAQFTVLLQPVNLPNNVLEGMTADISIEVAKKESGRLVPIASLHDKQVRRVRDGKVIVVPVETGLVNNEFVEVTSGDIKLGDQVQVKVQ